MDIMEELELVKAKLNNPQVDPNDIFHKLEKEHTDKPRVPADKIIDSVAELFNGREERRPTIDDMDAISVISLNDSESLTNGDGTIDLTGFSDLPDQGELIITDSWHLGQMYSKDSVECEEEESSKRLAFLEDTEKVMRLTEGTNRDKETVLAYLEQYVNFPNRVELVVEELLGIARVELAEELDEPLLPLPDPEPAYVGKGKGKGKGKSNRTRPPVVQPQEVVEERIVVNQSSDDDELPDLPESRKRSGSPILNKSKALRTGTGRQRKQALDPSTLHLHGPFNFRDHRKDKSGKSDKSSTNLRAGLNAILDEVTEGRRGKARKENGEQKGIAGKVRRNDSVEVLSDDRDAAMGAEVLESFKLNNGPQQHGRWPIFLPDSSPDSSPRHDGSKVKRGRLCAPDSPDSTPPNSPVFKRSQELNRPDYYSPEARRVPEAERQEAVPSPTNREKEDLITNLVAMFSATDPAYIRLRAVDLVGKPAAIERFTDELLSNPTPPVNWRQIYSLPQQEQEEVRLIGTPPAGEVPLANRTPPGGVVPLTNRTPPGGVVPLANPTPGPDVVQAPDIPVPHQPGLQGPAPGPSKRSTEDQGTSPLEQFIKEKEEEFRSIFPDYSPEWISNEVNCLVGEAGDDPDLQGMGVRYAARVDQILNMSPEEKKGIPTVKEWEVKEKERKELEKWTSGMTVQAMLDLFNQDPVSYFSDGTRVVENVNYRVHCTAALKSKFRNHGNAVIDKAMKQGKGLYINAYKTLASLPNSRKTRRPDTECRPPLGTPCIQFLKEEKYVELEADIKAEMARRAADRESMISAAKEAGELKECLCCYNDECLELEMIQCNGDHKYCKECVSRGANVAIGDGKTVIQCLGQCEEEISWQELQRALAPNVLSKLLQKRQAEEVATAGLEYVVCCPFCPYLAIMEDSTDKILVCKNPDCGRESCRLCQAPNHVPLRCEEVESRDEETARKKVEEQLTNAMIRECYSCKTRYMKEEGCNKMTCPKCAAIMCYLCKLPVKDYSHFYGQGATPGREKKCPLWSDTKTLHAKEVAEAAAKARGELAEANIQLKADPTTGIPDPTTIKPNQDRIPGAFGFMNGANMDAIRHQQHIFEHMIRHRQQHRIHAANGAGAGGNVFVDDMAGMVARMGEIYRVREEGRAQQRLARRAEMEALRDLRIHNWIPRDQPAQLAAAALPPPVPHAVPPPVAHRVHPHHALHHRQHHPFHAFLHAHHFPQHTPHPHQAQGQVPHPPVHRHGQVGQPLLHNVQLPAHNPHALQRPPPHLPANLQPVMPALHPQGPQVAPPHPPRVEGEVHVERVRNRHAVRHRDFGW